MNEISILDILDHYSRKAAEADDMLLEIGNAIKGSISAITSLWSGAAANVCALHLERLAEEVTKVQSSLSDAQFFLSSMKKECMEKDTLI